MKQKIQNNTPVTKDELVEALKAYPTKQDLKKELSNYATKADLNKALLQSEKRLEERLEEKLDKKFVKRLTESQNAFRSENDHKLFQMEERFAAKLSEFSNKILTAIDPLLKELETRQQDREIGTAQMQNLKNRVDDHENRLTKIEKLTHKN